MTNMNAKEKSPDDFKLSVVIRVEGRAGRALALRFVGIVVALVTIVVKLAVLFAVRAH